MQEELTQELAKLQQQKKDSIQAFNLKDQALNQKSVLLIEKETQLQEIASSNEKQQQEFANFKVQEEDRLRKWDDMLVLDAQHIGGEVQKIKEESEMLHMEIKRLTRDLSARDEALSQTKEKLYYNIEQHKEELVRVEEEKRQQKAEYNKEAQKLSEQIRIEQQSIGEMKIQCEQQLQEHDRNQRALQEQVQKEKELVRAVEGKRQQQKEKYKREARKLSEQTRIEQQSMKEMKIEYEQQLQEHDRSQRALQEQIQKEKVQSEARKVQSIKDITSGKQCKDIVVKVYNGKTWEETETIYKDHVRMLKKYNSKTTEYHCHERKTWKIIKPEDALQNVLEESADAFYLIPGNLPIDKEVLDAALENKEGLNARSLVPFNRDLYREDYTNDEGHTSQRRRLTRDDYMSTSEMKGL